MSTHTAIATTSIGVLDTIEVPTPSPASSEVLIKIQYASLVPLDFRMLDVGFYVQSYPARLGFNAAGTIVTVGSDITNLSVGDRVIACNPTSQDGRSLQQFGIFPAGFCSKVPDSVELSSAVTIPDNFITAYYMVFNQLSMQAPSKWPASTPPPNEDVSILVYGCGSSVGQFVLQLLKLAGYTKIFVTASKKHHAFLHELGATHAFDYSSPTLAHDIQKAAGGKITVGIDSISTFRTLDAISQVLEPEGKVAILLPVKDGEGIMDSTSILLQLPADRPTFGSRVEAIYVNVSEYLVKNPDFIARMSSVIEELLANGSLKPNRISVFSEKHGNMQERVGKGFEKMKKGDVSGEKLVVEVEH